MFPSSSEDLKNLSLTDRAFTHSSQKYTFRKLMLCYRGGNIFRVKQLTKAKKFLDNKPSFANHVRILELGFLLLTSLPKDPNFTSILQLFAKSPMPPHELHLGVHIHISPFIIEDSIFVTRQLGESFFSQTLTVLHISECANFPLLLFLICPRLRVVFLNNVGATDMSHDKYADSQCSGREAPALEVFDYRKSQRLVEQMISPHRLGLTHQ